MTAVHRYEIPVDGRWHTLSLPHGGILHTACRRSPDVVELWALHDDSPKFERQFRVYGTGHPVEDGAWHVGTAFAAGGALVWHLFEKA